VISIPQFRDLMSLFPTGVAVVTSTRVDGGGVGMTCSSLASVCLAPPVLLVSLHSATATCCSVLGRGGFAVNLLHGDRRDIAQRFSAPVPDRFAGVPWRWSPGGLPWLKDCVVAAADCVVVATQSVGDHTVIFGEVRNLALAEDARPLLYGLRSYAAWAPGSAGVSAADAR
jgi:flavin reductase (DIM6/NTAB) family NADH-FMN oxidoreductase RutF